MDPGREYNVGGVRARSITTGGADGRSRSPGIIGPPDSPREIARISLHATGWNGAYVSYAAHPPELAVGKKAKKNRIVGFTYWFLAEQGRLSERFFIGADGAGASRTPLPRPPRPAGRGGLRTRNLRRERVSQECSSTRRLELCAGRPDGLDARPRSRTALSRFELEQDEGPSNVDRLQGGAGLRAVREGDHDPVLMGNLPCIPSREVTWSAPLDE